MPYVEIRCAEYDKQNKQLAAEYQRTIRPIKRRINELHCELNACEGTCTYGCRKWRSRDHQYYLYRIGKCPKRRRLKRSTPSELRDRIKILNNMYRTTYEIGREAEHYYERDWWRSENYTFNTRKRG